MMQCERYSAMLAQYVVEGCPSTGEYHGLREHLAGCPPCQRDFHDLRRVELALRSWPPRPAPPHLTHRILAAIERETPVEAWTALPWSVWLPALTLLVALALAALLVPPQPAELPAAVLLDPAIQWSGLLQMLDDPDLAYALWIGGSAALAGIGITLALMHGRLPNDDEIDDLRDRVSDTAQRFWRMAGR